VIESGFPIGEIGGSSSFQQPGFYMSGQKDSNSVLAFQGQTPEQQRISELEH